MNDPGAVAKFLSDVSLFDNVKADYLLSIAKRLEDQIFQRDQTIVTAGEAGDTMYIIKSGSVGVFMVDPTVGLKFELARLRAGQVFGEMALLTKEPRTATCQAMEPTECLVLTRDTFMKIVERIPHVALGIAEVLAKRVAQLNREKGSERIDLSSAEFDPDVFRLVPRSILERHEMIPLAIREGVLTVACTDPTDLTGLDEIRRVIRGVELRPVEVSEVDYRGFVNRRAPSVAPTKKTPQSQLQSVAWMAEEAEPQLDQHRGEEIKLLVDMIISQAIDLEASDVHIEPELDAVKVRYRVSGALVRRPGNPIPRAYHRPIASRIKVLADLDISERRRPQDGRVSCRVGGRAYDLRVATMPTSEGEKIVLRVLDPQAAIQPLNQLILADKVCRVVEQMVSRPHGIVFVCGPTGSGKTTTLYSAVGLRRRGDTNIITVEDPVEYNIPGITQVNVHPEIGLDFAAVLRSMLRQDPNVMLVGETRDRETGQIALEAGLTGHLVLTSLHTNDALGAIQRLREMDLEDYAIAAALIGVVSQRLVRRLCPVCAKQGPLSATLVEQLALIGVIKRDFNQPVKTPVGCQTCGGSGYRGRVAAFELLVADDNLRQGIISGADQFKLKEIALSGAYVPLARYSNYLLSQGLTAPEELLAIHST